LFSCHLRSTLFPYTTLFRSKFFLANPQLDVTRARELFHLNATEATRILDLRPRQQALLKRPDVARVITLRVDAESHDLYTNTSKDRKSTRLNSSHSQISYAV